MLITDVTLDIDYLGLGIEHVNCQDNGIESSQDVSVSRQLNANFLYHEWLFKDGWVFQGCRWLWDQTAISSSW